MANLDFDAGGPPSLAEQALENLVNQFARPLDFLRELAQNSIDAGSPRIEVAVAYEPPEGEGDDGVLRIHVDDYGEGMDEDIIDNQLTRLFSSTKEDDLTKIGKFGIGFTSIFAIKPEAVLLRTGRHGEYWELLFHADRSFDKIRIDDPIQGTKITLFKRLPGERVAPFVQEVRFVLDYWCEHSDTPLTFEDRTQERTEVETTGSDPFQAFADGAHAGAERINRPLALDAVLQHVHREDGLEVAIGYADPPRFGFYNGGLTLLNTQNTDVLGEHADQLSHLSFRVKHDGLEHTLTRDNVLHDHNWERAMAGVLRARAGLRQKLVERTVQAVSDGAPIGNWHGRLAAECRASTGRGFIEEIQHEPLLRDAFGKPLTLDKVRRQEGRIDGVLVAEGPSPLLDALGQNKVFAVDDHPQTRAFLLATEEPPLFDFLRGGRRIRRAEEVFVLPSLIDRAALDPLEQRLLDRTEELLRAAVGIRIPLPLSSTVLKWEPTRESVVNRLSVRVGDFGGMDLGGAEVLALNGPTDGKVFFRPVPTFFRLPGFLTWRTLLVNRHHPLFRAQLLASAEDLDVAAFGLASALLHCEGLEGEGAYNRMISAISESSGILEGS
ncbi:MAG: ATP-binding protein [Myxococcota bacterium]